MESGISSTKTDPKNCDYDDPTYWSYPLPNVDIELMSFLDKKLSNSSNGTEVKHTNYDSTRDMQYKFTDLCDDLKSHHTENTTYSYNKGAYTSSSESDGQPLSVLTRNTPTYINDVICEDMFTGKALVTWLTSGNEVAYVVSNFVQEFCTALIQKELLIDQCAKKSAKFSESRVYSWKNFIKVGSLKYGLSDNASSSDKTCQLKNPKNEDCNESISSKQDSNVSLKKRFRKACSASTGSKLCPVKINIAVQTITATKQNTSLVDSQFNSIGPGRQSSSSSSQASYETACDCGIEKVVKLSTPYLKSQASPIHNDDDKQLHTGDNENIVSTASSSTTFLPRMKESFLCDFSEPLQTSVSSLKCAMLSPSRESSDCCLLPPSIPSLGESSAAKPLSLIMSSASVNHPRSVVSFSSRPSTITSLQPPSIATATSEMSNNLDSVVEFQTSRQSLLSPSARPPSTADIVCFESTPTLLPSTASSYFTADFDPQTVLNPFSKSSAPVLSSLPVPPSESKSIHSQPVCVVPPPPPIPPPPPSSPFPRTRSPPKVPPPPPPPCSNQSASSCLASNLPNSTASQTDKLMKPLYWTKINLEKVISDEANEAQVWKNIQAESIDENEIEALFSKQKMKKSSRANILQRKPSKRIQRAKILDTKRSQAVGIFVSSLHIGTEEVREAIINADLSTLDIETMEAIYDLRPQDNELEKIKAHLKKQELLEREKQQPLDKPEEFLYILWKIPDFSELIFCVTFTEHFKNDMEIFLDTIEVINRTCRYLQSDAVLKLLGVILSVGNILNRGNRTRGSADGFKLDILPKLKDVKANDDSNLLCYIAKTYITSVLPIQEKSEIPCPLPPALDVLRASHVQYSELQKDLDGIRKRLEQCEQKATAVIKKVSKDDYQAFCDFMADFFAQSFIDVDTAQDRLIISQRNFSCTATYFGVKSQNSKTKAKDFFGHWISFCSDLHTLWPDQLRKVIADRKKSAKTQLEEKRSSRNVVKVNAKTRSLKSRLENKSDCQPKK